MVGKKGKILSRIVFFLKKIKKPIWHFRVLYHQDKRCKELVKRFCSDISKPIYYVITCDVGDVGLFSYVSSILSEIDMAVREGWVPVVDMKSYASTYLERKEVNKKNAWEFYFEQPSGMKLEDIKESKNIICSEQYMGELEGPYSAISFYSDIYGEKSYWRKKALEYLVVREPIKKKVDKWCNTHWSKQSRVLGVLCRGTDYVKRKPTGHPVQPEVTLVIEKARELQQEWNCNLLYLCTEDGAILEAFMREMPENMSYLERQYVQDIGDDVVTRVRFDRADDKRIQGEEYLTQVLILARCNCLLAGQCGGTLGAELLTDGFEKEYIWDLGRY